MFCVIKWSTLQVNPVNLPNTKFNHPFKLTIEIVVLEGESTNEKWTIFLGYQGKLIMVLTSAVRLGWLLQKKKFCNSIKQVSLVSSADVNTIIFWPFWSSCMHKCILLLEFTTISMKLTRIWKLQSKFTTNFLVS